MNVADEKGLLLDDEGSGEDVVQGLAFFGEGLDEETNPHDQRRWVFGDVSSSCATESDAVTILVGDYESQHSFAWCCLPAGPHGDSVIEPLN